MIDAKWAGAVPGAHEHAVMLVAILVMSDEAERETDPFARRVKLNEMQAAIQQARPRIEAVAEGLSLGCPDAPDA